ncbi:MAG TPA: 3'-5' exonuclease, partial [Phycisphaerales bacterium]|nr:3'-5' exonuclease [Phycisphaerales bacterium]
AIIGLEEGVLPGQRAMESDGDAEEERRLFFVGITRAMRRLLVTNAKYRSHRGLRERAMPSRFLGELPREQVVVSDVSEEWLLSDDAWETGSRRDAITRRASPLSTSRFPPSSSSRPAAPSTSNDPSMPVGARVRHAQFGTGKVLSVTGLGVNRRATVEFRDAGTKTLVLQYARLEVV